MHGELKWFFILIFMLFVAWIATGGPSRSAVNRTHPFIKQPAPTDDGKVYTLDEVRDRTRP